MMHATIKPPRRIRTIRRSIPHPRSSQLVIPHAAGPHPTSPLNVDAPPRYHLPPHRVVGVLGSRVHLMDRETVLHVMHDWIRHRGPRCRQIVVTGFHGLWEAYKNGLFKHILNSADLWLPDGIAPVLVARARGMRNVSRLTGSDLLASFCERGNERGYRSFFYGDTDETLAALKHKLETKYPGHKVVGTLSPPFRTLSREEDEAHIRMINAARPDVLWVGLGLTKQDPWIYHRLHRLQVPIAIGVGAAFAFVSGRVKRAPGWVGRSGLEWLFRLLQEPKKCFKRSIWEGPQFIAHVFLELMGIRSYTYPVEQ